MFTCMQLCSGIRQTPFVYLKEPHFSKPQSAPGNIHPSILPLGISCAEVAEAAFAWIPAVKGQEGHTLDESDALKDPHWLWKEPIARTWKVDGFGVQTRNRLVVGRWCHWATNTIPPLQRLTLKLIKSKMCDSDATAVHNTPVWHCCHFTVLPFSGLQQGNLRGRTSSGAKTRWLLSSGLDQCDKHNPPLVWEDFFCYITFCSV